MLITNTRDLALAYKQGKYTSYGCYPLFFLTADGEALSREAVLANYAQIATAVRENSNNGWHVIALEVNWEDTELHCADTGARIESAYGDNTTPVRYVCTNTVEFGPDENE